MNKGKRYLKSLESYDKSKSYDIGEAMDFIDLKPAAPLYYDRHSTGTITDSDQFTVNKIELDGKAAHIDAEETDTIYQRATAICRMHKARVRANNYYWIRLENLAHKSALPRS